MGSGAPQWAPGQAKRTEKTKTWAEIRLRITWTGGGYEAVDENDHDDNDDDDDGDDNDGESLTVGKKSAEL